MVSRSRRNFDIELDSESITRLNNLANATALYPNRVKAASAIAAHATKRDAKRRLQTGWGNVDLGRSDVVPITVTVGYKKITIRANVLWANVRKGARTQSDLTKARLDANIKLRGRRRYTAKRSKSEDPYNLKRWKGGAIEYAFGFTVPAKSPNYSFRRFISGGGIKNIYRQNLTKALKQQGIGSRGGVSRVRGGDNPV